MVAYLSKSDASEGFNQIIDFLSRSSIKYALTVNPNIYVSCIKLFWNTVAVKHVNDVTRLQALVDKKKCMSAKRTSWNEFSSSMAYATICLSSGDLSIYTTKYTSPALTQKVFANMRRVGKGFFEVETPLFEGMLVAQEVRDERADVVPGAADNDKEPSIPSPIPPTLPPQPSQDIPFTSQKVGTAQRIDTSDDTVIDDVSNQGRMDMDQDAKVGLEENKEIAIDVVQDDKDAGCAQDQERTAESQAKIYKIDMDYARKVLSMQEDETMLAEVQEVVEVVTTAKLIYEVTAASDPITAASTTITVVATQVPAVTLTTAPARVTAAPRRRKKEW
nr:hypothetical protein [Tanacetum cinerariifolium]